VVPVQREDWLRVARSFLTPGYWSSTLDTHPGYTWYLDRVAATVELALQETGAEQVGGAQMGQLLGSTEWGEGE
jgi:hypothetical protein